MNNYFYELTQTEMKNLNGGKKVGVTDIIEKVSPLEVGKAIYHAGEDFGAASVKFGRECYDFYKDVKDIFSK